MAIKLRQLFVDMALDSMFVYVWRSRSIVAHVQLKTPDQDIATGVSLCGKRGRAAYPWEVCAAAPAHVCQRCHRETVQLTHGAAPPTPPGTA